MRVSIRSTNVLTIQTHSWLPFAGGAKQVPDYFEHCAGGVSNGFLHGKV